MRICLDTNVLVQLFGKGSRLTALREALVTGRVELVISTEIVLEYEEVVTRLAGAGRWRS